MKATSDCLCAVDVSPVHLMEVVATGRPHALSIVYGDRRFESREVLDRALRLAGGLRERGVGPGDRVALLARNSPEFFFCYLACAAIGAVFVPLNFRLAQAEVAQIVDWCDVRVFITEPEFTRPVPAEQQRAGRLAVVVDDDPLAGLRTEPHPSWVAASALLAAEPVVPEPRRGGDPALICFTSGSTGQPRGVVVTHGNLWWTWRNMDEVCDHRLEDVTLAAAPLGHLAGLNGFALRTLVRGGAVVVARGFDAGQALRLIERHRVTTMFAVPSMLDEMRRHPDFPARDLRSLRLCLVGSTTVDPELITDLTSDGLRLMHAWGMSETSGACLYLPPERALEKPDSVGIPLPYADVHLVDPASGAQIDTPGVVGELVVSGPLVVPGYWNEPAATAEAIRDGRMHSGDLAILGEDGFYRLVGRSKDMIISGGENIYPAEVEHAIREHPAVRDVVVVGAPDETWGETVVAFVEPEPGETVDLPELRDFCACRIARYKLPHRLVVVDRIPLNGSGKPDRRSLREAARHEPAARL
jgi:fatty-acyl-CoA synthase